MSVRPISEVVEHGLGPSRAAGRKFEHGAAPHGAVSTPALAGGAVDIPCLVEHNSSYRVVAVRSHVLEYVERGLGPGSVVVGRQFENRAASISVRAVDSAAAQLRGAVEVAGMIDVELR